MTYFSSPKLSHWQRQIVLGTILGGSSVVSPTKGKNCYLYMRSKEKSWLAYKAHELQDFASERPFTNEANTTRWHSNCFPVFNEYRELFYRMGKKVITPAVLDPLMDIGLAIWFGDSGRVLKNRVILNTHRYGAKGSKVVVKWLASCGLEADVWKLGGTVRVRLSEEGSNKFVKTIAHRLPECMYYKLSHSIA